MALTIVVGLNVLLEEYESFTNLRTSIHLEQYVHIQIGGKTQAKFTGPHDEVTADFLPPVCAGSSHNDIFTSISGKHLYSGSPSLSHHLLTDLCLDQGLQSPQFVFRFF